MSNDLIAYTLPSSLYRRLRLVTEVWCGVRPSPESLLVKCHEGGDSPPLFWCGTPDTLTSFYEVLGNERSVYCLCGTYGILAPSAENIQMLARYYAAEIIKVQPQGPYVLGGYCEAGLISYEIAKLMHTHSYPVGILCLFDRDVTDSDIWLNLARRFFLMLETASRRWEEIWINPGACIKETVMNKWQQLVVSPWHFVKRQLGFAAAEPPSAVATYRLTPYPGKIHLIYVKFGQLGYFQFAFFQRYWRQLAQGGIDYRMIPGTTHRYPDWSLVAKIMRNLITEVGI